MKTTSIWLRALFLVVVVSLSAACSSDAGLPAGASGASGTSGTSGAAGASGNGGASGASGNGGASGTAGEAGAAGETGMPQIAVAVEGASLTSGGVLAFGQVAIGASADKTLTIRNMGDAPLVLSGDPEVTGDGFSLSTPPASLTLAAGDATTAVVTFHPATAGPLSGALSIASNESASPFTLDLTGTGTDAGITLTGYTVTGAGGTSTISSIGGTLQLTETTLPAGAVDPGVTWSSDTPGVATVDENGLVTAVGEGTALITATATDGSGASGSISVTVALPFVYFVAQANGTTTASLADGTFSVSSTYSPSGNAFKYVAPNYYGTVSNGFIAFPTPMTGDFSISADVTLVTQNKANNACGIGLGITTGFNGTDSYAYMLMRNSTNVTNGYYVNGAGSVSAGSPSISYTNGTPLTLTFSRTGSNLSYSAGPVGGPPTTQTSSTSNFTNGTTVYGAGPVYPAISFNNVVASITNLVIKDGTGATVFDSATGKLVTYVPAALSVSTSSVSIAKGASTDVTATATAVGGAPASVTAVSADPTIATADVSGSTITLTGVQGGTTTVTVTNTGDSNDATNTKTITVTVNDYPATDNYGSITGQAYPVPGVADAYTDGAFTLTFDAPPVLNTGGSIKIFRLSDGTEVDNIAFAGETETFGTTTINVGSQLVRVNGNVLSFSAHPGKLAYGTGYYVVMPTTAISGTLNGADFTGFSNLSSVATWNFTTRATPTLDAGNVTVDGSQSSTADFRTVQGALGSIATLLPGATDVTINVAAGTYDELLRYTGPGSASAQTVHLVGPTGNVQGDSCTIQFANGNVMNGSTQTRASFYFTGANLVLENVTLRNTATRAAVSQAESLYFASGRGFTLAAFNSSFYSNQDTIQTSGQSWFYSCHVEGNVDFIWGTADVALFENSSLRFVNDVGGAASYSLFVARTGTTIASGADGTVGKGYVLLDSTVSVDANVTAYFGRDAGTGAFYDQAALINVSFTGAGTIGNGLWNVATPPLSLGDSSYVGWKSAGCSGLNLATNTTDPLTSALITDQATEYDTRDNILNRVVTVTAGVPSGFQAASNVWDVSTLAGAWGAP